MSLLKVDELAVSFRTRAGTVKAVRGVSFEVNAGESLGIVGESGCGKSVTCFSLVGLIPMPPGKIEGGQANFSGHDLLKLSESKLRSLRGREVSLIFQDPMTYLNPYLKIGTQLAEPLHYHSKVSSAEAQLRSAKALEAVGLPEPERYLKAYPHELSGGQRQRILIAMALILEPKLLIADEPTTALDVTIQAQILDLIEARQKQDQLGVVLVTHDLSVVAERCNEVVVMYAGIVVEKGPTDVVFANPQHPYTRALMRARPTRASKNRPLFALEGGPPDLSKPILGDPLALRPGVKSKGRWATEMPPLRQIKGKHWARESDVELPELEDAWKA